MAQRKSFSVELKSIDEAPEGSFKAVFSRFGVVDHDGDVTLPGAFQKGQKVPIAGVGHNWDTPVIGVGIIDSDSEKAWVDGLFNLKTQGGREHYESVKFSHEHGVKQEYSYAYDVVKKGRDDDLKDWPGANRILEKLDPKEISPVMMGAGIGTGTLAVKAKRVNPLTEDEKKKLVTEAAEKKEQSHEDTRNAVSSEIRKQAQIETISNGGEVYSAVTPWIMETYDDHVIVCEDDMYYSVDYSIDKDGKVTLGDPVAVEQTWSPKSLDGSSIKYADHAAQVLATVRAYSDRSKSLADLKTKEGRSLSKPNRERITSISTATRAVADELDKLLAEVDPDAEIADEAKRRRLRGGVARARLSEMRLRLAHSSY